ncbi:MAG: Flp family type IVb pilin [Actinobacteria bacterium]|jgi:pilus assembly protein Flp/PilA|nr:Flp family type IVb pilin [Actinomycetota bacterium]
MITRIRTALRHDEGASAVEYGLLVAAIAAVIVAVVFLLGQRVSTTFDSTNKCISKQGVGC